MRPLLTMLLAMTMLITAAHAASDGHSSESDAAVDLPLTAFIAAHPVPRLAIDASYQQTAPPPTFLYLSRPGTSANWFSSLTDRFNGVQTPFVLNPGTSSQNNPGFGQVGALPIFAGGMLRRFPQVPEGSFSQMAAFGRQLRSEMSVTAGLRALDRAHGVVAAIAVRTRYGQLSVERGESQGRFGAISMQPVTIVRYELPWL